MKAKNKILRGLLLLALVSIFLSTKVAKADPGDSLFTGIKVHTLNIIFSYPNYWDSLTIYYNQGNEQYIPATVIANGITYNNVGVRLKGNSSYTHPNNKKSMRLSFNEYVSAQRWNGLKGIHLNNAWNDPTFIREKLHLDFCQDAGVVAPRSNFVRVSINDTLFAFYSLVEHVDKIFLDSRYGNDDGDYFKAVDGFGAASDTLSDFRWYGPDSTRYYNNYELKSDLELGPWKKLLSFLDTLNHSSNVSVSLPQKVNMSTFYKAMAVDNLLGNLDSYAYNSRNFYIYFLPPLYNIHWMVWDASLSVGGLPGGPSNIENLSVTYVQSDTGRPFMAKVVNDPILKNEYLMALCNIFTNYFSPALLNPKIDSIANLIRPYVYEDPRKMYTNQQFETNIISDLVISGLRKPGLKSFISSRRTSVQSQLNTLGIDCSVGINPNENLIAEEFKLEQNFPNPFNPKTLISYELGTSNFVTLKVFDVLGNEVATLVNQNQVAGSYTVSFDAAQLSSGIYFYKLSVNRDGSSEANARSVTKKMLLIK